MNLLKKMRFESCDKICMKKPSLKYLEFLLSDFLCSYN